MYKNKSISAASASRIVSGFSDQGDTMPSINSSHSRLNSMNLDISWKNVGQLSPQIRACYNNYGYMLNLHNT